MRTRNMWMFAILFLAFFAVSCEKDDDPEPINEAQILIEYLESAEVGNYVLNGMPAIKTAEHVKTLNTAGTNYIIDIRQPDAFEAGHIENAVNVAASEVLTHLEGTTADDDAEEIYINLSELLEMGELKNITVELLESAEDFRTSVALTFPAVNWIRGYSQDGTSIWLKMSPVSQPDDFLIRVIAFTFNYRHNIT